jgi:hypothetical protein
MAKSFNSEYHTQAEQQFHTSSVYDVLNGYTAWSIRTDYPSPDSTRQQLTPGPDAPWLTVNPFKDPQGYLEIVKEYCFDGMVNNDFIPQDNTMSLFC